MALQLRTAALFLICAPVACFSQSTPSLTLQDALKLAKERNGTVKVALLNVKSADSQVTQALAAFFPTVSPTYTYNSTRQQVRTTGISSFLQSEGGVTSINSQWRLLDSGERSFSYNASRRNRDSARLSALQTLRTTLFNVTQQYYEALRAQELQKVAEAQVVRTAEILKSTDKRIAVGDAAKIERLQANVDFQNAKVNALTAKNQTTTTAATLKGTIGYGTTDAFPVLVNDGEPTLPTAKAELATLVQQSYENRSDLGAKRKALEADVFNRRLAERLAGPTFSVDLTFNEQLAPDTLQDRILTFAISFPLFDGGKSRAAARNAGYTVESDRADLVQSERNVRAEVESAYAEFTQNAERLDAARSAKEAAEENYKAAAVSRDKGAYDLIQVLTAQVSLVTAESNYIQAVYDYKISEVRLKLVTGQPVPGEQ